MRATPTHSLSFAIAASLAIGCSPPDPETTELSGEVSVSVVDGVDGIDGDSTVVWTITDDTGTFTQIVPGDADLDDLASGDVAHVSGVIEDGNLVVHEVETLLAAPPAALTKQNRTVLVIPLVHDGDPNPIPTNQQIDTALNAAYNYFQKNSPASLAFTTNIFPPMRSGYSAATGAYGPFLPMALFATGAYQIAGFNGVNASVYDHVVMVGNMACAPAPAGTVTAAQGDLGGRNLYLCPGSFPLFTTDPAKAVYVIAHELGHNFGLNHSAVLKCGNKVYGTTTAECPKPTGTAEYSNLYDVMGGGTTDNWLNAVNRERLDWITLTYANPNGVYKLNATEAYGTINKGIRVRAGNVYYYLEYRKLGHRTAGKTDLEGILVHTQPPSAVVSGTNVQSVVLDMTPSGGLPLVLPFGTVFKDPSGLQISATRVDTDNVTVTLKSPPKIAYNWGQPNPMQVPAGPSSTPASLSTAPITTVCDLDGWPSAGPSTEHSWDVYHDLPAGARHSYSVNCAQADDPDNTATEALTVEAVDGCSLTLNGSTTYASIPVGGVAEFVVTSTIAGTGTWIGTNNDQPISPTPQGPAPGQWSFELGEPMTGTRAMVISGPGGTCTTNTVWFSVQ